MWGQQRGAFSQAEIIAEAVLVFACDNPDGEFALKTAFPEQCSQLAKYRSNTWTGNARYFITTAPINSNSTERRVIVFCDHAYNNVPRYTIGKAPLTHAVSYSDGSTGLLTVAQFKKIDRSSFVPLDELPVEEVRSSAR